MPIVIKTEAGYTRNANGTYSPFAAVGEKETKDQLAEIEAKGAEQVGAVNAAGSTQVSSVNSAGQTQVNAINAAGTSALQAVAGQTDAINTAGAAAVQAIEQKANSFPDYAQTQEELGELKEDITALSERQYEDFAPAVLNLKNELLSYASGKILADYIGKNIAYTDERFFLMSDVKGVIVPNGYRVIISMYNDKDENTFVTGAEKTADFDPKTYRYKYARFCIRKVGSGTITADEARGLVVYTYNPKRLEFALSDMTTESYNGFLADKTGFYVPKLNVGRLARTGVIEGSRLGRYTPDYIETSRIKHVEVPTGWSVQAYYYAEDKTYKTDYTFSQSFTPSRSYPYARFQLAKYSGSTQMEFNDDEEVLRAFRIRIALNDDNVLYQGDVCPRWTEGQTQTSYGVAYKADADGLSIDGTASQFSFVNLYYSETELPNGIVPGRTYLLEFNGLPGRLNITLYHKNASGWQSSNRLVPLYYTNAYFTVPDDAIALRITIGVNAGYTVHEHVTPHIYDVKSLSYLSRHPEHDDPAPMLTILYDDGLKKFKNKILPVIQEKKVPIGTCVIASSVDEENPRVMTYDEVVECYRGGAEILVHSKERSESEWGNNYNSIAHEMRHCKNTLNSYGCNVPDAYIYSADSANFPACRHAVEMEFMAGVDAGAQGSVTANLAYTNYKGQIDNLRLVRRWADCNWNSGLVGTGEATLKSWIDELSSAKTGWQIWCRHNYEDETFDNQQTETLRNVIDYALEKGVKIVTLRKGMMEYL